MQNQRYFEFHDDKSAKFWEVSLEGTAVTVRYGKIGTNGQSQTKEFADAGVAAKHVTKLVAEKTGKGYVESGQSAGSLVASESVPEAPTARKTAVTNPAKDPEASPESLLALLNKDDATNRLLARHPRASADLLEKLSHSSDKATRQGVAANPNTPPETYVKLGQQFPKEFLANPALDLLLMLNPALMEEVPEALLVRLLKQADCPASLLTWAAGRSNSKVQLAVAMNANAPESARQRLGQSFDPAVREAVRPMSVAAPEQDPEQAFEQALRERIGSLHPYELQEAWKSGDIGLAQWSALPLTFRLAQVTNSEVFDPACVARLLRDSGKTLTEIRSLLPHYTSWKEVAKHHFTPVHVLFEFSEGSDALARIGAAENHTTPLAVLETLAKDSYNSILIGIAVNPSTPEPLKVKLLDALDGSLSMSDLKKVATNPATPAPVLEKLSKHSEKRLRHAVAENLATPVQILEALAEDADGDVRRAVARNPAMPVPVLEILACHSDRYIQCAVAKNPSTPVPVLETLAENYDGLIRHSAATNPSVSVSILEILSKDNDKWIRSAVAENPSASLLVLETLARDSDDWVRYQVAKNPSASLLVLETLARDSDVTVRRAVAGNPSTTPGVLEKLSTDKDTYVKEAAISNPNTPLPALIKQVSAKAVGVRQALASQSHRSPEILHSLWKDTHDSVRQAVASCPGLTQAQLDEILQGCELESDLATLLVHPNMGVKSVECIFDKLFSIPAADSAWYQRKLAEASYEIRTAAQAENLTFYHGKDPNKAVLAKRALAPLMALCAGPFIEPARLVKVVGSTDWLVRAAVARNPGTPPNLLKKLSTDAHPLVAALAKKALVSADSNLKNSINNSNQELIIQAHLRKIKENYPIGAKLAAEIIGIDDRIDLAYSRSPQAMRSILKKLSTSKNPSVRRNVLRHHETPDDVKVRLVPEFISDFLKDDYFWRQPNFDLLKTIDSSLLKKMLNNKNCPDSLKEFCSTMGIS
jgi:predicted DNA-binding WGR domain protein